MLRIARLVGEGRESEEEFSAQFFRLGLPPRVKLVILCAAVMYYSAFAFIDLIVSPDLVLIIFRAGTLVIITPLLFLRICLYLSVKCSLIPTKPRSIEKLDMCIFYFVAITGSFLTAIPKRNLPTFTSQIFMCAPIFFPSRVKVSLPVFLAVLVTHLVVIGTVGQANLGDMLLNAFSVLASCALMMIFMAQSEIAWRENFALKKQTEAEHEEKVQMAMELVHQTQQMSQAKSRMVSIVSHELRSPCQAISGMCGVLAASRHINEDDRECVNIVGRSSDLLVALINDFLNLSRLDSDQITLKHEPVCISTLVEDIFDFVSPNVYKPPKTVELIYEISPDVPGFMVGDPERLKQVFLNLTANAAKFCETGFISISVRFASQDEVVEWSRGMLPPQTFGLRTEDNHFAPYTKKYLLFTLKDTGIGLEQENLAKIFEEFFMVDTGPSRKQAGTGLGLAIVKKLVLLMGGSLRVHSQGLNQGCSFEILLPFVPCESAPQEAIPTPVPPPLHSDPPLIALILNKNKQSTSKLQSALKRFNTHSFTFSKQEDLSRFLGCDDECESAAEENENTPDSGEDLRTLMGYLNFLEKGANGIFPEDSGIHVSAANPRLSVAVFIDSNSVQSSESALSLLQHCRSLEFSHFTDLSPASSFSERALLRFKFIFCSPVQDSNDLLSLNALGYFSKLPKPLKNPVLAKLLQKVWNVDQRPETWQPKMFGPARGGKSLMSQASGVAGDMGGERRLSTPEVSFVDQRRTSVLPWDIFVQVQTTSPSTITSTSPSSSNSFSPSMQFQNSNSADSFGSGTSANVQPLLSILIVDDNIINQQVFSRMLRPKYSCDISNDGAEAVKMVGERLYSCVLMDFHMVFMDGITATRKIRSRNDAKGRIPIIGLSADSLAETKREAEEAGMTMYITKPVKKEALIKAIEEVTQGQ